MRRRLHALAAALSVTLAAAALSGCASKIDYEEVTLAPQYTEPPVDPDDPEATKDVMQETVIIPENLSSDTYSPISYTITPAECDDTYQPEEVEGQQCFSNGLEGYNGEGFISLTDHEYATIPVNAPSSQYYDISVRLQGNGAKAAVIIGGTKEIGSAGGEYRTLDGAEVGAVYAGYSGEFETLTLKGVYLSKGENNITVQVLQGSAYIDELNVKNGDTVPVLAYEVSNACVDPNAGMSAKAVKRYLTDVYGNKVVTGQFCSAGTDTEINAVYMSTGRYSAMRCSDLGIFTNYYEGADKNNENEIATAINWWKKGGLVCYTWYWNSPQAENSSWFTTLTDFSLKNAVTDNDIAALSASSLETYLQTGRISSECMAIISDIDAVAAKLKLLEAEDVPVLFRPLPEAGNSWYWWGEDSESYLWLYKFLFKRITEYHRLTNILWVWDGESYDYYPGDDFCDFVGMDIYTSSDISGSSRMLDAIGYTIRKKGTALTECGRIPSPDTLTRDGAYWLWFALWKGDYIINPNGTVQYSHVTATELDYAYNNSLFITLDELPDFSMY